ncbi:MAG: HAMP domain-containing histidine kinase [Acidobacteria bacterium]|nr:HAMP domain-containing histidine kinase [Acidobacteriota bacterium]
MSLRTRLLLTTLAVAVPLTVALFFVAERWRHADKEDSIDRFLSTELSSGIIGRCETEGGGRGGRGGGPRGAGPGPIELIPYTRTYELARRGPGPAFPDALKEAVMSSGRAVGVFSHEQGRGLQVAVRISDTTGPCDILLARMRPRPGESRDLLIGLASILLIVVAAIWFAVGPTIARIHRLAQHVRSSAASHYGVPVPDTGQDEVGALARAFNEAGIEVRTHLTDVEAREATLREFVANTAHDVATPLTVLQSHLASLEGAPLPPAHAIEVNGAIREAHYMASRLRNLTTASRLEGGVPIERVRTDLNGVIERVVARLTPLARAAGVEVNFAVPEGGVVVEADPTLVEQAISNLVDNGIRYNTPGGHVAVVLDRTGTEGGSWLAVEDDGLGVKPEELPHLATRRFRGDDARSRRPDGQGIGLAIVAEAIARSGWTLRFRANTPSGLTAEVSAYPIEPSGY